MERIDCNDAGPPYFPRLVADHHDRTETAVGQAHTFRAMELAIRAQRHGRGGPCVTSPSSAPGSAPSIWPATWRCPSGSAVTHVCDLDEDRARPLAAASGAACTADLAAVLADPGGRYRRHLPAAASAFPGRRRHALAAGKHAVCEKPLVASVREADRLLQDCRRRPGSAVFPIFQYRYGLGASQMRALIDAGLTGKPYAGTLETHWNRPAGYYDVPWRGTWAGEQGGAILGHAIHIHDWLSFIFGPVAQVYADLATRVNADRGRGLRGAVDPDGSRARWSPRR